MEDGDEKKRKYKEKTGEKERKISIEWNWKDRINHRVRKITKEEQENRDEGKGKERWKKGEEKEKLEKLKWGRRKEGTCEGNEK